MKVNQKVSGLYCGESFFGTIAAVRSVSVDTDGCVECMINLDAPITVYKTKRNSICVYVKYDGSPSSYSNYTDAFTIQN